MIEYSLRPSLKLITCIALLYLLALASIFVYFPFDAFTALMSVLILLLIYSEIRAFVVSRRQASESLKLHLSSGEIEWFNNNNRCRYSKYTVYSNRGAIILKLNSGWMHRHLMLIADRFQSSNDYLDFRYQITHLN